MTFPIQIAIFGAAAVFTALYLIFNQNNRNNQLTYSNGSQYYAPPEPAQLTPSYDTHPRRRRSAANEEKRDCVICLCEMDTLGNQMLQCGHVFHTACIRQWLREARVCPTCRKYA